MRHRPGRGRIWLLTMSLVLVFTLQACADPDRARPDENNSADPLPSWRPGPARNEIVDFVIRVTSPDSAEFVPEPERIAVFDNDGTLWSEQPAYFQLLFAMDRVRAMAPEHPEWKNQQPFQAVLDGDLQMLQWTAGGSGSSLVVLVHHTDAEREWAYDRDSHIGHLDAALEQAGEQGWLIVDMRRDWNSIYPVSIQ